MNNLKKKIIKLLIIILFEFICIFINTSSTKYYESNTPIPILTYHSVTDNNFTACENMFVKPSEFEKQMKMITEQGFTPIFADEIKNAYLYKNPIIITFDDGYIDNYQIVYPVIKENHIKITIFIITNNIDKKHFLTSTDLLEMYQSGFVSIQSHTASHKRLTLLDDSQLEKELKDSKNAIIKLIKKKPLAVTYPFGSINQNQIKLINKYYQIGFTSSSGVMSNDHNKYIIKRYQVNKNTDLKSLCNYLRSFK